MQDQPVNEQMTQLSMLRECRLIFGPAAARALWAQLDLPKVGAAVRVVDDDVKDKRVETITAFVSDCCVDRRHDNSISEKSSALYAAHLEWAQERGIEPLTQTGFSLALQALGFNHHKSRLRRFSGISLV